MAREVKPSPRTQLMRALAANGISPNLAKWKDAQGLGNAVGKVLKAKR